MGSDTIFLPFYDNKWGQTPFSSRFIQMEINGVRHHFPPVLYKWIDQFDAAIFKVLDVSGGYGKPVGEGDAGNLSVEINGVRHVSDPIY